MLRSKLAEGIPEFDAPAIEPLVLDRVRLLRGPNGARLDINVTGLQVDGFSKFIPFDISLLVLVLLIQKENKVTKNRQCTTIFL